MLSPTGGTVRDGALYVERTADTTLIDALIAGELCFVSGPRQIGKSSLIARTARVLQSRKILCARVDLTLLSSSTDQRQACSALIRAILREPGVRDLDFNWTPDPQLSPLAEWITAWESFTRTVPERLVIFLDEADKLHSLSFDRDSAFRTGFLSALRMIHEAQRFESRAGKVTFCLAGVTTLTELATGHGADLINLGRSIFLDDFSRRDMDSFEHSLASHSHSRELVDEVFHWTHGHPFLTQVLCSQIASLNSAGAIPEETVAELVSDCFLNSSSRRHCAPLAEIERRFSSASTEDVALWRSMIETYRKLLTEAQVSRVRDDQVQNRLILSGIAAERQEIGGSFLKVRNNVFRSAFTEGWLNSKDAHWQIAVQAARWRASGTGLIGGIALRKALSFANGRGDLTKDETDFIDACKDTESLARRRSRDLLITLTSAATIIAVAMLLITFRVVDARSTLALAHRRTAEAERRLSSATLRRRTADRAARDALDRLDEAQRTLNATLIAAEGSRREVRAAEARQMRANTMARGALSRQRTAESYARREAADIASQERRVKAQTVSILSEQSEVLAQIPGQESAAAAAGIEAAQLAQAQLLSLASTDLRGLAAVVSTGQVRRFVFPHNAPVLQAAFSPDDHVISTVCSDGSIRLWNIHDRKVRWTAWQQPSPTKMDTVFSRDGRKLLTSSLGSANINIWDTATGALIRRLRPSTGLHPAGAESPASDFGTSSGGVTDLAISHDGARLLASYEAGPVLVWSLRSGEVVGALPGNRWSVWSVAFSGDDRWAVTGGNDHTARLWDMSSYRCVHIFSDPELGAQSHLGQVSSVAISSDDRIVLTAGRDETLRLWDLERGTLVGRVVDQGNMVPMVSFSPDDRAFLTASPSGLVKVWATYTGQPILTLSGHHGRAYAASFSADGRYVLTASSDRSAQLWDLRPTSRAATLYGHADTVYSVVYTDSNHLLTGSADGSARLWDCRTGHESVNFEEGIMIRPDAFASRVALVHHTRLRDPNLSVRFASISGDGRYVLTGHKDRQARLWDARTGAVLHVFHPAGDSTGQAGWINAGAFLPDRPKFLTGDGAGSVRMYDLATGQSSTLLSGQDGSGRSVQSIAVSKDGHFAAAAVLNVGVLVFDLRHSRLYRIVPISMNANCVAFSPDGVRIAVASVDGLIRILETAAGGISKTLSTNLGEAMSVSFSADGRRLGAGYSSSSMAVWDAASGEEIVRYRLSEGVTQSVALSPDGKHIAGAFSTGIVKILPADAPELLRAAQELFQPPPVLRR